MTGKPSIKTIIIIVILLTIYHINPFGCMNPIRKLSSRLDSLGNNTAIDNAKWELQLEGIKQDSPNYNKLLQEKIQESKNTLVFSVI